MSPDTIFRIAIVTLVFIAAPTMTAQEPEPLTPQRPQT